MKNVREPIWWMPLLRRVLTWGAMSSLCIGGFFFVFAASLALPLTVGHSLETMRMGSILGIPFCVAGLIIGCAAGLCAPPREPTNLFVSPFFRAVFADTLLFWLLLSFAFGLFMIPPSIFIDPWPSWLSDENWLYVAAFITFIPSLWRATNRALRAAEEANRA